MRVYVPPAYALQLWNVMKRSATFQPLSAPASLLSVFLLFSFSKGRKSEERERGRERERGEMREGKRMFLVVHAQPPLSRAGV